MSMSKCATGGCGKPIVKYRAILPGFIVVGHSATVTAINHPSPLIFPGAMVHTSEVLSYDEATGNFETKNTLYELAGD